MTDLEPETAQSTAESSAAVETSPVAVEPPPRKGRGGRRPGAGRPKKHRPARSSLPKSMRPEIGEVVWYWERPEEGGELVPRAATVVACDDPRTRNHDRLTLAVLRPDGNHQVVEADPADEPTEARWTLRERRGGPHGWR